MKEYKKWVGFDLDGTLAYCDHVGGHKEIGEVIWEIIEHFWLEYFNGLANGYEVRIFTARACEVQGVIEVRKWLIANKFPKGIKITNEKDRGLIRLYDDRVVAMERNTGKILSYPEFTRGEK